MRDYSKRDLGVRSSRSAMRRRPFVVEVLEPRQLLASAVSVWTGAANDGGKFSTPANWNNNTAPVQIGETAEFLAGATVTLDVPVQNDATVVENAVVSLDLAGQAYQSQGNITVAGLANSAAQLNVMNSGAPQGSISAAEFTVGTGPSSHGELSFNDVNAQCSGILVATGLNSVGTLDAFTMANVGTGNGPLSVGQGSGSLGTVVVSNSASLTAGQLTLGLNGGAGAGPDGVGMLNIWTGGAFQSDGGTIEGYSSKGESTATVDGSGSAWDATSGGGKLVIGNTSQGEVIVSDDGSLKTSGAVLCNNGGQGSVVVNTGASWTDSQEIEIGGLLGGSPQVTSMVTVTGQDANGTMSSLNANNITVGATSNGQLILDAGVSASASGSVIVNSVAFDGAPNSEIDVMQGAQLTSASGRVNGGVNGGTLVFINGGIWQTIDPSAIFPLGSNSSVMATFKFDNLGRINCAGGLFKNLGYTVEGSGWIQGHFKSQGGGIIRPGPAAGGVGELNIDGDLDLAGGDEFDAALGSSGVSSALNVTGNATLAGNFYATSLVDAATYTWGDSFTVLTAATITGQFANLPAGFYDGGSALPQLRSGYMWYVSYGAGQLSLSVMGPPESMGLQDVYDHTSQSNISGTVEALNNPMVPVTYQIVSEPQYGTVTLDPNTGAYSYTSTTAAPFDTFSFDATDAAGTGNVASVELYDSGYYVGGGYSDPFAGYWVDSRLSTPVGQTLTVGSGDAGDPIPAGDYPAMSSQLIAGQSPQHAGSFILNSDGTFSYTPVAGFSGIDWFTYQVTDSGLQGDYATVFIDVTSQNNPSALPANITASPSAAYTYDPTTNDLTLNSGTLTFAADTTSGALVNLTASGSDSNIIFATSQHLAGLTLVGGATATVQSLGAARTASNHNVLVIGSLGASSDPVFTVSASSKLDLEDNDLIVHTGSSDAGGNGEYANVNAMAVLGRNPASGAPGSPDGQWNGNGLASSAANTADTAAGYEKIALAVVLNSTLFIGPYASWQVGSFNETLGSNDIIVKYTYLGDYGLFGKVYDSDGAILQMDFDNGASDTHTWATGSSMDDGLCDDSEAGVFQFQYGLGTGGRFGPQL